MWKHMSLVLESLDLKKSWSSVKQGRSLTYFRGREHFIILTLVILSFEQITCLDISSGGGLGVSSSTDGSMKIWQASNGELRVKALDMLLGSYTWRVVWEALDWVTERRVVHSKLIGPLHFNWSLFSHLLILKLSSVLVICQNRLGLEQWGSQASECLSGWSLGMNCLQWSASKTD